MTAPYVDRTAIVEDGATLGPGVRVWHFTHVMPGAVLGEGTSLGQGVFVGRDVRIGAHVRVQNHVSIFEGVEIEDHVFLGPSCTFTNVKNPRAEIPRKDQYARTLVRRGATIGASATLVCGITVGRYAFVGAGAVVTRDVADYALVLGVPARPVGWMSRHGHRLVQGTAEGDLVCPESGWRYREHAGILRCLDRDEDAPL